MDKFCNFLNSLKGNGPRGHCSNATRLDGCGPCSGLSESRNLLNSCDSFRIIQEINEAYEKRLRTYECAENETELKVNTMQLWINDLREQNELLLDIVEKLEKEAMDKQKLGCDMEKNYSKELEKYQQMMCCKDRIIETQQHALEDLKTSVCNNQTQGKCTACRNVNRSANGNIPPECAKCFKSKEKDRLSCIPEDLSRSSENLFRQACSVIELTGQLKDKEMLICSLEEKLRVLKCLPVQIVPLICKIKQQVINLCDTFCSIDSEEFVNEVQNNLESIIFDINEILLVLDKFKDIEKPSILHKYTVCDNQHLSVTELFRGKNTYESSTTSSINYDIKQLMKEVQDQDIVIDDLRTALTDAHDQIKDLNASNYNKMGKDKKLSVVGGTKRIVELEGKIDELNRTMQGIQFNDLHGKNESYQLSCEKLMEELQYLKTLSKDESCCGMVSSKNQIAEEQECMIQDLKGLLNHIEDYFLEGFNQVVSGSKLKSQCAKDDKMHLWMKNLLQSIGKASNCLTEIECRTQAFRDKNDQSMSNVCFPPSNNRKVVPSSRDNKNNTKSNNNYTTFSFCEGQKT